MEEPVNHAQAQEIIHFQMLYNKQKMKATWVLSIFIVLVFLLEELSGGSQNVAVLVRMGANVSERVWGGEYYRLLSAVFLHAGYMHVLLNVYVLFALGGFFNRIFGETRYLTVFFFSGICGSLASLFFSKASLSVGASGAIWGLFGASLALALFKTSLLPEPIRLRLRRVTFINVVINLGISFLPMIDFWAHIGGGIGGFLVSLLIIFQPKNVLLYRINNAIFSMSAVILSIIYFIAIAYVIIAFKPWQNQFNLEQKTVQLSSVPLTIAIPEGLKQETGKTNNEKSAYFSFGDPLVDKLVIEVHFFHQSILGAKADYAWLAKQQKELLEEKSLPPEVKKSIFLKDKESGGTLYYQQTAKNGEFIVHNYVVTKYNYAIRIGILVTQKILQSDVDKLAQKMIESIQSSAAASLR